MTDTSLQDYHHIALQLKMPPSTLRRKISTWNAKAKDGDKINPDAKSPQNGTTKFYFNAVTIEHIKAVMEKMSSKRGRPKKEAPC